MSDEQKKPDPIEDVRKGLGLLFRAARNAVDEIPTDKIEGAVKTGAREVTRVIESVTNTIEKELFPGAKGASTSAKAPSSPPPAAEASPAAPAAAAPPQASTAATQPATGVQPATTAPEASEAKAPLITPPPHDASQPEAATPDAAKPDAPDA